MKQTLPAIRRRRRQFRKSLNPRSETQKAGRHLRASDIILAITLGVMLVTLFARLLTQLLGLT